MHTRTAEILGTDKARGYIEELGAKLFSNPEKDSIDPEALFNRNVEELYKSKLANEKGDTYWILDTSMRDTIINIPKYYFEGKKPILQPFDIRFTLGIYYNYLKRTLPTNPNVEIPFHWDDWVDTSVLNKYLLANDDKKPECKFLNPEKKEGSKDKLMVAEECCVSNSDMPSDFTHGNKKLPGFNVRKHTEGKTTPENAILFGKSYVYTFMPPPTQVLILTHQGFFNVSTGSRTKLLDSGLVEEYISLSDSRSVDVLDEYRKLSTVVSPHEKDALNSHEHEVSLKEFMFDYKSIMTNLEDRFKSGGVIHKKELDYLNSLKYSDFSVNNGGPPKYFGEAKLVETVVGDHYDWRFFNGVLKGSYEQTLTLHRLIRAWLSFTRKTGIVTWVAHGSLLSWYWNGMAFPWDDDIDVQVPIMDLHKLSLNFNQSLIVEDTEDGYGRYFLDCGTFMTLRSKGNGNNNIDARFIDIDTGLYVDITGLAVSNTKPPERYSSSLPKDWNVDEKGLYETNLKLEIFNCRNNHFSSLSEISPLVKTAVEGEVGYIPKRFTNMLSAEYHDKGLMSKKFSGHVFVSQLRLWLSEKVLKPYLSDREAWREQYSIKTNTDIEKRGINDIEMTTILNLKDEQLLELLWKDEIFMKYYSSYKFTEFHQEEMVKHWMGKSSESHMNQFSALRPLFYEPFAYNIRKNHIIYDEEVAKSLELQSEYLNSLA